MDISKKRPAAVCAASGPKQFVDPQISATDNVASSKPQGPSRILATIPRGPHAIDRVTEQVVNDQRLFDVRRFRPYGAGMYRPTPSGLTLRPDAARAVALAILEALDGGQVR